MAAIFDPSRTIAGAAPDRAVRDRIGAENFRSGLRFAGFEQRGDKVVARFIDRESGAELTDEADILVGADGIHSAVRRQLYPAEGEPRFAQQILWRAAIEAEPFLGRPYHGHCRSFPSAHHRLSRSEEPRAANC